MNVPLPGIDQVGVQSWFHNQLGASGPLSFRLIAGGKSNLTYLVSDPDGRRWALRRPPAGEVRATAHDMAREFRLLSALHGTSVPLPNPLGLCSDVTVTGAPFYVMEFVDGVVMDRDEAFATLDTAARSRFQDDLARTLARLHAIDLAAVGLDDLRRPEPLVDRQLRRWRGQLSGQDSTSRDLVAIHTVLIERAPQERESVLVHGDFRPGNVIVAADGTIAAVLDWELAAAGDPLVDLGWLAAWWSGGDDVGWSPAPEYPNPGVESLLSAYNAERGSGYTDIEYHRAFALWRLACISLGVYERFRDGAMGDSPQDLEVLRDHPVRLARLARAALEME